MIEFKEQSSDVGACPSQWLVLKVRSARKCNKEIPDGWIYVKDGDARYTWHGYAASDLRRIVEKMERENAKLATS